jgi:hypothetical protein
MIVISWLYRQLFNCCRRIDTILFSPPKRDENDVSPSTLPWLWVGAVYSDDVIVDYTNEVNDNVYFGLHVTPELLNKIFKVSNVTWRYLDTKTLETIDFPSAGFVIDDSEFSDSEDSHDE